MKFLPLVAVLLAGCATNSSGVMRTGADSYTVRTTASQASGGGTTAKRNAYEDANKECVKQGKVIQVTGETTGNPTWTDGMHSVDLAFRCV